MKKYPNIDPGEPEEGQILASTILRWCLEHRDSYPWEDGTPNVFYDIPATVAFEHQQWLNISKKDFAEKFSVLQSQVSRWIRAGMPVRKDGRLNYDEAIKWTEAYDAKNEARKNSGWRD